MALKECTLGTPYPGAADRTFDVSNRPWPRLLRGKGGAADALFIVQYGTGPDQLRCGCYGSSIEAPDFDAPAKGSVLSNNVHTTALFADLPTRSCILTARNHHSNAMPCITEGFPCYFCGNGNIPFENSFLSETLLQHDHNTTLMRMANRTQHLQTRYWNNYLMNAKFTWFFLVSLMLPSITTSATPLPIAKDIITSLALTQDQVAKLDRGEIVALKIGEATEKELAISLGIYLPLAPAKLVAYFKSGALASIDPDTIERGDMQPNSDADVFKRFTFSSKQGDEAEGLLDAAANDKFNLSTDEIGGFAPLKTKFAAADDTALIAGVTQHYREILLQRWQAYRKGGLPGIAPYARRDGPEASPAKELRAATVSSKFLARYYPDLYNAWLNYPAELPAGAEEQFYWLNRKVENRPTAILGHRVLQTSDAGSVILSRQFFVGHSYNSSQLTAGCLPYRNGSIVFYTHRTSTDQVAGMGSSLKHSIGREQMKEQMVKNLERIRSASRSF